MNFRKVTRAEFDEFIKKHPNTAEWDQSKTSDPPIATLNDYSNGVKWPESIIGQVRYNRTGTEKEFYIK